MRATRRTTDSFHPMWSSAGSLAAFAWLDDRGVPRPSSRWYVQIAMDVADRPTERDFDERRASRFHLDIYSEEWGFYFCHAGKISWIRTTDVTFVHARDDYRLIGRTPELPRIGELVRELEREHGLAFRREHALVETDLGSSTVASIRRWIETL